MAKFQIIMSVDAQDWIAAARSVEGRVALGGAELRDESGAAVALKSPTLGAWLPARAGLPVVRTEGVVRDADEV